MPHSLTPSARCKLDQFLCECCFGIRSVPSVEINVDLSLITRESVTTYRIIHNSKVFISGHLNTMYVFWKKHWLDSHIQVNDLIQVTAVVPKLDFITFCLQVYIHLSNRKMVNIAILCGLLDWWAVSMCWPFHLMQSLKHLSINTFLYTVRKLHIYQCSCNTHSIGHVIS